MRWALALLLVSMLALLALPASAQTELLTNGGFEQGSEPWAVIGDIYGGVPQIVDTPVKSGTHAAALSAQGNAWLYQKVDVVPDGVYTFSGWGWKDDPAAIAQAYLSISWRDDSGKEILSSDSQWLSDDQPEWRQLTVTDNAPDRARQARLDAVIRVDGSPGTAYFDDLSFVLVSLPPPTPTPEPTPTPAPTPTATPAPEPMPTPTPVPTPTSTATPVPTATPTLVPTPTAAATPTLAPTATATPLSAASATPIWGATVTPGPTAAATTVQPGDVLISEVMHDPPQPGNDAAFEWIELFNTSDQRLALTGWWLFDNVDADPIPDLVLEPFGYAVVAASAGFYQNFPDFSGTLVTIADGRIGNGLSNTGDRIIIRDGTGRIIDALSYGEDSSVFNPALPLVVPGHSLERQVSASGGNPHAEFWDNAAPSPGRGPPPPAPSELATETGPPLGDAVPPAAIAIALALGLASILAGLGVSRRQI